MEPDLLHNIPQRSVDMKSRMATLDYHLLPEIPRGARRFHLTFPAFLLLLDFVHIPVPLLDLHVVLTIKGNTIDLTFLPSRRLSPTTRTECQTVSGKHARPTLFYFAYEVSNR